MQKDVQLEQHEEAQPKKKAKGLDLASGAANCKQTSAVPCDLWHHHQILNAQPGRTVGQECSSSGDRRCQVVRKEWLGRPDKEVEEVRDLGRKTRLRTEAREPATDKTASFIRVMQTESLNSGQVLARNASAIHVGLVDVLQEDSADISGQVACPSAAVTSTRNIGHTGAPEACAATDALKASSPLE